MEYNLDHDNEFSKATKGNVDTYNYNTNQMCNRCQNYKTSNCPGRNHEMFKQSFNHYCPSFKDRSYGDEQAKQHWHLEDFVKNYEHYTKKGDS